MRDLACADQADALKDAAENQDPAEQQDDRNGGEERIDQGEKPRHHHQNALEQIP